MGFLEDIGATQVWVTFDSQANVDTSLLIPGTMHTNPAFEANAPDPNDVAVITFATPVEGIVPAVLPTLGLLDELGEKNGLKDQLFTVVGYGANQRIVGEPGVFSVHLKRRFATSELNALEPALLRLAMNAARGLGGASFGDSGGPIFRGERTQSSPLSD